MLSTKGTIETPYSCGRPLIVNPCSTTEACVLHSSSLCSPIKGHFYGSSEHGISSSSAVLHSLFGLGSEVCHWGKEASVNLIDEKNKTSSVRDEDRGPQAAWTIEDQGVPQEDSRRIRGPRVFPPSRRYYWHHVIRSRD